jgi:hypothetical protein
MDPFPATGSIRDPIGCKHLFFSLKTEIYSKTTPVYT